MFRLMRNQSDKTTNLISSLDFQLLFYQFNLEATGYKTRQIKD